MTPLGDYLHRTFRHPSRRCVSFIEKFLLITSPQEGCELLCMSVYMSACITLKPNSQILPNFCSYCLWMWLSPSLMTLWYVIYFQFCG